MIFAEIRSVAFAFIFSPVWPSVESDDRSHVSLCCGLESTPVSNKVMTLKTWMKEAGISPLDLSEKLEVTRQYVYLMARREREPSIWLARRMIKISKGALTEKDLRVRRVAR
jgi:DNA-binding XRE family transcriptional regulator